MAPSNAVVNWPGFTEFVEEYPAPAVTREEEDGRTAGGAFSWECFRVADYPVNRNHVCSQGSVGFRNPIIPKRAIPLSGQWQHPGNGISMGIIELCEMGVSG